MILYIFYNFFVVILFILFFFFNDTATTEIYTLSLHDALPICTMSTEYKPLVDYLANALGMEVRSFVATDYNGVIEALRSKKLDVAMLGPFSYVLAAAVADVEAFGVPETGKGGISYHAVIIARK